MEAAIVIAVVAIVALVVRERQHDKAADLERERYAELLNDMASRVVRPTAPTPRRIAPPERSEDDKSGGQGHLVGRVQAPGADSEE